MFYGMSQEYIGARVRQGKRRSRSARAVPLAAHTQESQPCCVYFCGADSTGKSELVKYVATRYCMRKVPETARSVLHEEGYTLTGLRVKSETADAYQLAVFERQIAQEARTERPFVADRGLDNLAYASEHGRCAADLAERPEVGEYVTRQREAVVFLVRPHKELRAEDGTRALPSWEGQNRIDAKIELLLQLWRVPHVVIAESSAARREEQIDWCLKARGFEKR
jgi:nicotinamide riboside kinase